MTGEYQALLVEREALLTLAFDQGGVGKEVPAEVLAPGIAVGGRERNDLARHRPHAVDVVERRERLRQSAVRAVDEEQIATLALDPHALFEGGAGGKLVPGH